MRTLWRLSGKRVWVTRDLASGNTLLSYRDTLPEDFAPALVLDASGRVRATYRHWQDQRRTLVPLRHATKRYGNLTINLWRTGGGKQSFKTNMAALIAGLTKTLATKPDETWLIVHHKATKALDVPKQVLKRIKGKAAKDKVHFIHWGQHHATNAFVDIPNVVLAGTLFYRPSHYEALARLAAGLADHEPLSPQARLEIEQGEHADLILQALCRGPVRRNHGGECGRMAAYIIADTKTGIPDLLTKVFPGALIKVWRPIDKPLKGRSRRPWRWSRLTSRSLEVHLDISRS